MARPHRSSCGTQRRWLIDLLEERAVLSAGNLDRSWGDFGGTNTYGFSTGVDLARDSAVDKNGRVVMVGQIPKGADQQIGVLRFRADGRLDGTFNGNGKKLISFGTSTYDVPSSIAIQPDGKILIVGYTGSDVAVARLNDNGTFDTTFDGDGLKTIHLSTSAYGTGIGVQSTGKIIVLADAGSSPTNRTLSAIQLNADGSRTGTFTTSTPLVSAMSGRLVVQSDDKILLTATAALSNSNNDMFVARLLATGGIDTAFGVGGLAKVAVDLGNTNNDQISGLTVQPDGKILISGSAANGAGRSAAVLARLNTNGTLDTAFAVGGKYVTPTTLGALSATDVALQPDGRIVLSIDKSQAYNSAALLRLLPTGKLDYSFNGTGLAPVLFDSLKNPTTGVAAVHYFNGALYATGYHYLNGSDVDFGAAKFQTGLTRSSIIGHTTAGYAWTSEQSTGSNFDAKSLTSWPAATYADVSHADLNGDGRIDFLGRNKSTGQWVASLSNSDGTYATKNFGSPWSATIKWTDTRFGDVDDDGRDDLVTRNQADGKWYVATSTGSGWTSAKVWATWAAGTNWANVQLADMNGDGKLDLVGRNTTNGQVNVGLSSGTTGTSAGASFTNSVWSSWPTATYADVLTGDINGDGKADITARDTTTGIVQVALSTGAALGSLTLFATWSKSTWSDVTLVDMNNDGKADLVSRCASVLFVDVSSGTTFNHTAWSVLPSGRTYSLSLIGDYDGDGYIDVATRNDLGEWRVSISLHDRFAPASAWGKWGTSVTFADVFAGVI